MSYIKFEEKLIKKGEFMSLLTSILENSGWVNVNSNVSAEGWIYQSKGENGKSNILINIRDGYDGHMKNSFSTTSTRGFDIRPLISYTPATSSGVTGVTVPPLSNTEYSRVFVGMGTDALYEDAELLIRYNCNKDRLVMTITTLQLGCGTTFLTFGRPSDNVAKEYADTGTMYATQNAYRYAQGTWGIADRPTSVRTDIQLITKPLGKSFVGSTIRMSEIAIMTDLEGYKGTINGMYVLDIDASSNNIDDITIEDELGNQFKVMYLTPSSATNYGTLIKNKAIAVCTRLAGEE